MTRLARRLGELGFILRSGGAKGADRAFEKGATLKEIFYVNDATILSINVTQIYHPAWDCIPEWAKKLHGRNAMQVLGRNLDQHVKFVLCWTADGAQCTEEITRKTGGTGQAIRIATAYKIPVFNLKRKNAVNKLSKLIKKINSDIGKD